MTEHVHRGGRRPAVKPPEQPRSSRRGRVLPPDLVEPTDAEPAPVPEDPDPAATPRKRTTRKGDK